MITEDRLKNSSSQTVSVRRLYSIALYGVDSRQDFDSHDTERINESGCRANHDQELDLDAGYLRYHLISLNGGNC